MDKKRLTGVLLMGVALVFTGIISDSYCQNRKPPTKKEIDYSNYMKKGSEYSNNKDYNKAISEFTNAIKVDPKNPNAYMFRGSAYEEKKDYYKAISDYGKAIQADPKFVQGYAWRAALYHKQKDYSKCWEDVHKAEALGFSFPPCFKGALIKDSGRKK